MPRDDRSLDAELDLGGLDGALRAAFALPADPPAHAPHRAAPATTSARYELGGEIARGGVGIVLRGRDTELGREVAIKVLAEQHAQNAAMVERFVEEAQIAGQLQHPGVVPVYELGKQSDQRPFFAMKLVHGRTLA